MKHSVRRLGCGVGLLLASSAVLSCTVGSSGGCYKCSDAAANNSDAATPSDAGNSHASGGRGGRGGSGGRTSAQSDASVGGASNGNDSGPPDSGSGNPDAGSVGPSVPEPAGSVVYYGNIVGPTREDFATFAFPGRVRKALSLQGFSATSTIYSMGLSPDGKQLAVAGRPADGSPTVLTTYALDGTSAPVTLVTGPDTAVRDIQALKFSPDGQAISFWAALDPGCDACFDSYVMPTSGGTPTILFGNGRGGGCATWAPDSPSTKIAVSFGPGGGVGYELWAFDLATNPGGTSLGLYYEDGTAGGCPEWGANGEIYIKGEDLNQNQLRNGNIFVAQDASTPGLTALPNVQMTNENGVASIGAIAASPDGTRLAFTSNAPAANQRQLYVIDLIAGSTPQMRSAFTGGDMSATYGAYTPYWSPDGSKLAASSLWFDNGSTGVGLYLFAATGPVKQTRLFGDDTYDIAFSADGQRLWATFSDYRTGNANLVATSDLVHVDQDPVPKIVQEGIVKRFIPLP